MDVWKYFTIGHENHRFCNPLCDAKVDELVELLHVPDSGRVLDVACGKGELLRRIVRRWNCSGVGVDLSEAWAAEARERARAEGLGARLEVLHQDAATYAGAPGSFDVASCLGASWIWKGHAGTLEALARFAKPGALVLAGEPFWTGEPPPEYLRASHQSASQFGTHRGNVETGERLGLAFLHAIVSSPDDWDRYEGYQWYAAERYASAHPDDPDVPELLATMRRNRDVFLRWGRAELGWACYLFQKP